MVHDSNKMLKAELINISKKYLTNYTKYLIDIEKNNVNINFIYIYIYIYIFVLGKLVLDLVFYFYYRKELILSISIVYYTYGTSFSEMKINIGKNGPLPSILEIICLETLFPNFIAMYHFFRKRRYRARKRHYRA